MWPFDGSVANNGDYAPNGKRRNPPIDMSQTLPIGWVPPNLLPHSSSSPARSYYAGPLNESMSQRLTGIFPPVPPGAGSSTYDPGNYPPPFLPLLPNQWMGHPQFSSNYPPSLLGPGAQLPLPLLTDEEPEEQCQICLDMKDEDDPSPSRFYNTLPSKQTHAKRHAKRISSTSADDLAILRCFPSFKNRPELIQDDRNNQQMIHKEKGITTKKSSVKREQSTGQRTFEMAIPITLDSDSDPEEENHCLASSKESSAESSASTKSSKTKPPKKSPGESKRMRNEDSAAPIKSSKVPRMSSSSSTNNSKDESDLEYDSKLELDRSKDEGNAHNSNSTHDQSPNAKDNTESFVQEKSHPQAQFSDDSTTPVKQATIEKDVATNPSDSNQRSSGGVKSVAQDAIGIVNAYGNIISKRKKEGILPGPCQFPNCYLEFKGENSDVRHIYDSHSKFGVYQCHICTAKVKTKLDHFRRFHKSVPRTEWRCTDLRKEYADKFIQLYQQCYPILTDYDFLLGSKHSRPPAFNQVLLDAIKSADAGNIRCKVCSKGDSDSSGQSKTAGQVEHHLLLVHGDDRDLFLFECYLCNWNGASIFHHAWERHRDIKFEDHRDRYEQELINLFEECYVTGTAQPRTQKQQPEQSAPPTSSQPPSLSHGTNDLPSSNSNEISTETKSDQPKLETESSFPDQKPTATNLDDEPEIPKSTVAYRDIEPPKALSSSASQPPTVLASLGVKPEPMDYDENASSAPPSEESVRQPMNEKFSLSVSAYWYILSKRKREGIHCDPCSKCSKSVQCSFGTHVQSHFKKPLYRCKMCSMKFPNPYSHFNKNHRGTKVSTTLYEDLRYLFEEDLKRLTFDLYPALSSSEFSLGAAPPPAFAAYLLQQLTTVHQEQSSRTCNICSSPVTAFETEFHVYNHSAEPIFECHLCSFTGGDFLSHFVQVHRDINFKFEDNRGQYEGYLMQLYDQCFGKPSSQTTSVPVQNIQLKQPNHLSNPSLSNNNKVDKAKAASERCPNPSLAKQALESQDSSEDQLKWIRGFSSSLERGIRQKRLEVPYPCSYPDCTVSLRMNLEWHMYSHSPTPSASCLHCSTRTKYNSICHHMLKEHNLAAQRNINYQDNRYKWAGEYLKLFLECFPVLLSYHSSLLDIQTPTRLFDELAKVAYPIKCDADECCSGENNPPVVLNNAEETETHLYDKHCTAELRLFECWQCTYSGPVIAKHSWVEHKGKGYELKFDDKREQYMDELLDILKKMIGNGQTLGSTLENDMTKLSNDDSIPNKSSTLLTDQNNANSAQHSSFYPSSTGGGNGGYDDQAEEVDVKPDTSMLLNQSANSFVSTNSRRASGTKGLPPRLAFYISLLETKFKAGYPFKQCLFPDCDKVIVKTHTFYYHLLRHVKKNIWQCGYCGARGNGSIACNVHTKKRHQGKPNNEIDLRPQISDYLVELLHRCHPQLFQPEFYFPDVLVRFYQRLNQILDELNAFETETANIECSCGVTIPTYHVWALELHVLAHLDGEFIAFECFKCSFNCNGNVVEHFVQHFPCRFWSGGVFEDNRPANEDKMLEMIEKCYGKNKLTSPPLPKPNQQPLETMQLLSSENEHAVERIRIINSPSNNDYTPSSSITQQTSTKTPLQISDTISSDTPTVSVKQEIKNGESDEVETERKSVSTKNKSGNGYRTLGMRKNGGMFMERSGGWMNQSMLSVMNKMSHLPDHTGWECAMPGCGAKLGRYRPESHIWMESKLMLFQCSLCGMRSTQMINRQHVLKAHGPQYGLDIILDKREDYDKELYEWSGICFPILRSAETWYPGSNDLKYIQCIQEIIRQNNGKTISCRKCFTSPNEDEKSEKAITESNGSEQSRFEPSLSTGEVSELVLHEHLTDVHFGHVDLFECYKCKWSGNGLRTHIWTVHSGMKQANPQNADDFRQKYDAELTELVEQCFYNQSP